MPQEDSGINNWRLLPPFLKAIVSHWVTLMSGGLITVGLSVFERYTGRTIPWHTSLLVFLFFVFLACFLAWRDEHVERQKIARSAKFPEVRFPGGGLDFVLTDLGLHDASPRQHFVLLKNVVITNNDPSSAASVGAQLLVKHSPFTTLVYDAEGEPFAQWARVIEHHNIASQEQLRFPLNIPPRASRSGHILFYIGDSLARGVAGDNVWPKQKQLEVEEYSSHEKRIFPINVVTRLDVTTGSHRIV